MPHKRSRIPPSWRRVCFNITPTWKRQVTPGGYDGAVMLLSFTVVWLKKLDAQSRPEHVLSRVESEASKSSYRSSIARIKPWELKVHRESGTWVCWQMPVRGDAIKPATGHLDTFR